MSCTQLTVAGKRPSTGIKPVSPSYYLCSTTNWAKKPQVASKANFGYTSFKRRNRITVFFTERNWIWPLLYPIPTRRISIMVFQNRKPSPSSNKGLFLQPTSRCKEKCADSAGWRHRWSTWFGAFSSMWGSWCQLYKPLVQEPVKREDSCVRKFSLIVKLL